MFNKNHIKNYGIFYVIVLLFGVTLVQGIYLWAQWNAPLPKEVLEVEVNLPVIQWSTYSSLPKQYEGDTLNEGL